LAEISSEELDGSTGGDVGTARSIDVKPGVYELRVSERVRIVEGVGRVNGRSALLVPEVPLVVVVSAKQVTMAAAGASSAVVWFLPLDEV
jgi:hypothetical protein